MENTILDDDMYGSERTASQIMDALRQQGYLDIYENNKGEIIVKAIKPLKCYIAKDITGRWRPNIESEFFIPEVIVPCVILIVVLNFFGIRLGFLIAMAITSGVTWLFSKNKRERLTADIQAAIHGS